MYRRTDLHVYLQMYMNIPTYPCLGASLICFEATQIDTDLHWLGHLRTLTAYKQENKCTTLCPLNLTWGIAICAGVLPRRQGIEIFGLPQLFEACTYARIYSCLTASALVYSFMLLAQRKWGTNKKDDKNRMQRHHWVTPRPLMEETGRKKMAKGRWTSPKTRKNSECNRDRQQADV